METKKNFNQGANVEKACERRQSSTKRKDIESCSIYDVPVKKRRVIKENCSQKVSQTFDFKFGCLILPSFFTIWV